MKVSDLIVVLELKFEQNKNQEIALKSEKYLKNQFPFYGIQSAARREIQKEWFLFLKENNNSFNHWDLIHELWNKDQREFKYVAIDWLHSWKKSKIQFSDISDIELLIRTHSWWDSVDLVASTYLANYFKKFPSQIPIVVNRWRKSDNIWLKRSCLLFQLKYKNEVDFDLLKSLITEFQPLNEFFIQKAIGWALRQYSKFNKIAVKDFIEEINLQGLAKREGSKYL
jgi:3-methyladenine DNA glycosylase AlkD